MCTNGNAAFERVFLNSHWVGRKPGFWTVSKVSLYLLKRIQIQNGTVKGVDQRSPEAESAVQQIGNCIGNGAKWAQGSKKVEHAFLGCCVHGTLWEENIFIYWIEMRRMDQGIEQAKFSQVNAVEKSLQCAGSKVRLTCTIWGEQNGQFGEEIIENLLIFSKFHSKICTSWF